MAEQKKKISSKPWEKMYAGKSAEKAVKAPGAKSGKDAVKQATAKPAAKSEKKSDKKKVSQYMDFLYLVPKKTSAKDFAKVLSFLEKGSLEVWEEECVLEITTANGTITFEDIRDSLEKEDKEVLSGLRMKQVLSCDYELSDASLVKKIMEAFFKAFGGKIGSDTEDFAPFITLEEIGK